MYPADSGGQRIATGSARDGSIGTGAKVILHWQAARFGLATRLVGTGMQLVTRVMLVLAVSAGLVGCSSSEEQARQAALKAQQAELKAEQAEAAANRAIAAARQAQIAADHAQKAIDDATREINRVADHLDRMNQTQGASD